MMRTDPSDQDHAPRRTIGDTRTMTTIHEDITLATLDNGLRIACQRVPSVRSVSARVFLPCGVIHEDEHGLGASTVCAELLMRGTREHDSQAQADLFDLAGAMRDTSVGARSIGVSVSALGDGLGRSIDLVGSMILDAAMRDESFEASRALALASLESLLDDPQERAVIAARARHLASPYNRSTYGSTEGLGALTADSVRAWWTKHCVPSGAIIGVAGAIDPEKTVSIIEDRFGSWRGDAVKIAIGDAPRRGYAHEHDDSNQVQIIIVHDSPRAGDEHEIHEMLVNSVLSGGMSGRLFTEVREKRGLCYSVSSSYRAGKEHGVTTAYVGTTPERAQESLDVLHAELRRIISSGVTQEEFERARVGLKSKLIFSGESTGARAAALVADLDKRGAPRTLAQIAQQIDAISIDELNAYLESRSLGTLTIQTLGPDPLTPPA
jgi:predicted Zn-dependent peptidase